jgi:formate/nitrite transporter FocA (FNT family)
MAEPAAKTDIPHNGFSMKTSGWGEYLTGFLLPTLAGNVLGGVGLVVLLAHAQVKAEGY